MAQVRTKSTAGPNKQIAESAAEQQTKKRAPWSSKQPHRDPRMRTSAFKISKLWWLIPTEALPPFFGSWLGRAAYWAVLVGTRACVVLTGISSVWSLPCRLFFFFFFALTRDALTGPLWRPCTRTRPRSRQTAPAPPPRSRPRRPPPRWRRPRPRR